MNIFLEDVKILCKSECCTLRAIRKEVIFADERMQTANTEKNTGSEKPFANVYVIAVHLLLAGIVILFLGISYAYIFSDNQDKWEQFHLPKIFWASSFCVLSVSLCLRKMLSIYKTDDLIKLRSFLVLSLLLAVAFLCCQYSGWMQMHRGGYTLADTPSSSYIYLLTWLHGFHILVGIFLLIVALIKLQNAIHNPVKKLLYVSDAGQFIRLKLLSHFWHTIDALWLFLFCLFLYQHA